MKNKFDKIFKYQNRLSILMKSVSRNHYAASCAQNVNTDDLKEGLYYIENKIFSKSLSDIHELEDKGFRFFSIKKGKRKFPTISKRLKKTFIRDLVQLPNDVLVEFNKLKYTYNGDSNVEMDLKKYKKGSVIKFFKNSEYRYNSIVFFKNQKLNVLSLRFFDYKNEVEAILKEMSSGESYFSIDSDDKYEFFKFQTKDLYSKVLEITGVELFN